jgi:hypothetical protein
MRRSSIKSAKPVAVDDFVVGDQELRVGCHLQAGFDIPEAIDPDERNLPVLHHRNGEARNLPSLP